MKKQMNLVVVASLSVLGGLVWTVAHSERNTAARPNETPTRATTDTPSIAEINQPTPPALNATNATAATTVIAQPEAAQTPIDDPTKHVAQPGETVTSLASNLLGKNNPTNRQAIINANPSLQADPDKLIAGKAYKIPTVSEASQQPALPVDVVASPPIQPPQVATSETKTPGQPVKVLKYTATPGDTVSNLAGAFLGNDDQKHQNNIINANPSLQADPDHIEAGKVYRIPAPNGLSASADSTATPAVQQRPAMQPDEDQIVAQNSPRTLRYTARAGDTVTTLAIQLLGHDTEESRDLIINNNPILKKNPDRVVAGQSYWIPAPSPTVSNP